MKSAPATIFISYSRTDHDFVERLKTDLQRNECPVWIDHEGLKAGTPDWEEAVRKAIRTAKAVLLVASPASRTSQYVRDELRIADMYKRPVFPVWARGQRWMDCIPLGRGAAQRIDARGARYEGALHEIVAMLLGAASTHDAAPSQRQVAEPEFTPRNPYKGLRAFRLGDAGDFFGRDTLVDGLVQALGKTITAEGRKIHAPRFLVVVGPSGSGKSSVMQAGLLPRLHAGALVGSNHWTYLEPLVPGTRPIESLAIAISSALPNRSLRTIREDLDDDSARGLHMLAAQVTAGSGTKLLIPVDQFEELFTLTAQDSERQRFVDLLLTAASEPRGPVVVVITLRADFYDRPLQFAELGHMIQQHQHPVFPMDLADLRAIVERPAALADVQVVFEGNLVGDLLFEMRGQPGALPLLQFTLDQLFERRSGRTLTLVAYREIGGVRGALAKHAEATYASLPLADHHRLTRALFLRLIDPGATEQDTTRRRAALSELSLPDARELATMREVVDAFVDARLLTVGETSGIKTIEVSHEALIREWALLSEWVREARGDVRLQKRISADALDWLEHGRPVDRLYRGTLLDEAQAWSDRNVPSIDEVEFLRASAEAERREDTERVQLEEAVRASRRQFLATLEHLAVGIAHCGMDGAYLLLNQHFSDIVGYSAEELVEKRVQDIIHPDDHDAHLAAMHAIRSGQMDTHIAEERYIHRNGSLIWVNRTLALERRESGEPDYFIHLVEDITERRARAVRGRDTLGAVLSMAEALVLPSQVTEPGRGSAESSSAGPEIARLAEPFADILDCEYLSISMLAADSEQLLEVAATGDSTDHSAGQESRSDAHGSDSSDGSARDASQLPPETIARLRRGEIIPLPATGRKRSARASEHSSGDVLVVPMLIGDQLIGCVTIHYRPNRRPHMEADRALAGAVARLLALMLERERLMHERTDAQAHALALAEANRKMDEFLGIAGHELRTPIVAININLQLAERRLRALSAGDEARAIAGASDLMQRSQRSIARLVRLVDDLLDVSRIRAGKLQVRREPCDLAAVVRDAVQELRETVPERTITLRLASGDPVLVHADADRIVQVITNLLMNAHKYSAYDVPIEVSLLETDENARVSVRDFGPGVPPAEQQHIWEPFHRVPDTEVRSGSGVGLGLGLYISRTILEQHGGEIGVESVPGEGATFWFTLPLAR